MRKFIFAIMLSAVVVPFSMNTYAADPDVELERSIDKICDSDKLCKGMIKSTMSAFMAMMINERTRKDYFNGVQEKAIEYKDLSCDDIRDEAVVGIEDNYMTESIAYAAHYLLRCQDMIKEGIDQDKNFN